MTKKLKKKQPEYTQILRFSGLAFSMMSVIGGLTFLGYWLDRKFPNLYNQYTVIFALLGVGISIYLVIKEVISGQ